MSTFLSGRFGPRRPLGPVAALAWGAALFVAAQVLLIAIMEQRRPEWRDPEYGFKRNFLRRAVQAEPERPLFVLLGSSRASLGFRPDALPQLASAGEPEPLTFNAAIMGSGPVMELLVLQRLLADGFRPRWVLIECWPPFWILEGAGSERNRLSVVRLGWSDLSVLRRYYARPAGLYAEWLGLRLAPCHTNRFILLSQYARNLLPPAPLREDLWSKIEPTGWMNRPVVLTPEQAAAARRGVSELFGGRMQTMPDTSYVDRAHREMLDLCRKHGIQAGLIWFPEAASYRRACDPATCSRLTEHLADLADEHEAAFLDVRDWMDEEDFDDGVHLKASSAGSFTAQLGREVLPEFLDGELLSDQGGEVGEQRQRVAQPTQDGVGEVGADRSVNDSMIE